MTQISPVTIGPRPRRRKRILLFGSIGVLALLAIWCAIGWFAGRAAQATHTKMEIEKLLADHASAMQQTERIGQVLDNASGPLTKVAALGPAIKEINAIRDRTVTIGTGSASKNVNVWAIICKVSATACILDEGVSDLTLVVDSSQKLLNFCRQYEANRSHFEQAMAGVRRDPSRQSFAGLADAAKQFRNSVATVDSHLAMLDGKLTSVHHTFATSRDLLAKIEYGPVRESAHSLANSLEVPIKVTEALSFQIATQRAGLEEAMNALKDIAQKASE